MKKLDQSPLIFWVAAMVLLASGVILPAAIGFMRPDYSWFGNYISELGAKDARFAWIINLFGFLPVAVSSAIAIFCLRTRLLGLQLARAGLVLLFLGLSVGYLWAFLFPCDFGCPIEGSARQMIHNLSGLISYPAGTLGLVMLAVGLDRRVSISVRGIVCAVAALTALGFVMMINPAQSDLRGFWQRLADFSMFALIVYLGFVVPSRAKAVKAAL